MTGIKLDYTKHCRLAFGDYAQTHEEHNPTNSMNERTIGAICLGPMENFQGGYKFMSLRTGKLIHRRNFTPILMTQEVIDPVLTIGTNRELEADKSAILM